MKRNILTHDKYRDVFDRKQKSVNVVNGMIHSKHNTMYTIINDKCALTGIDKKRYWSNSLESVAFDHPSIKRKHNDDDVSSSKRMKIV